MLEDLSVKHEERAEERSIGYDDLFYIKKVGSESCLTFFCLGEHTILLQRLPAFFALSVRPDDAYASTIAA